MTIRLFVMDHNCAFTKKQSLYIRLMERFDIHVTILAPEKWMNPFGQSCVVSQKHAGFRGDFVTRPVAFRSSVPKHLYIADLAKILSKAKPDIIYGYHDYYMLAAYQLFRANRRGVGVPIGFYASQNIFKTFPFPISNFEKRVLQGATFLFPISSEATDLARSKGFNGEICDMPLYVDTSIFDARLSKENTWRKRITNNPKSFLIGFAGRFVPEKGLSDLIDAVSMLKDESVQIVLVGQGPEQDALERRARDRGIANQLHIVPPTNQSDLAPVLAACDVIVMPSLSYPGWKEQFGRLIIEALACGTPVLGSDSGAIPEVIEQTKGGLIFPEGDPRALMGLVSDLRKNPSRLKELATRGLAATRENFTLDAMADRMGGYFESHAKRPDRARSLLS